MQDHPNLPGEWRGVVCKPRDLDDVVLIVFCAHLLTRSCFESGSVAKKKAVEAEKIQQAQEAEKRKREKETAEKRRQAKLIEEKARLEKYRKLEAAKKEKQRQREIEKREREKRRQLEKKRKDRKRKIVTLVIA